MIASLEVLYLLNVYLRKNAFIEENADNRTVCIRTYNKAVLCCKEFILT